MRILKAEHLGMCFGVRDAISMALARNEEKPVTILGELVHNRTVLDSLESRGIAITKDVEKVPTNQVLITAHGASDKRIDDARSRGFEVEEATCPLVHHAHRQLQRLVQDGWHPVVIGKRGHVEVVGMTEDHEGCDVVLNEDEIRSMTPRAKFGVVAQTTQPIQRVRQLVDFMRGQFPDSEIRFIDTVCRPTKDRQSAAERLGEECDVVIVIGGSNSNNTHELARTCASAGARVHHVQSASELREKWFGEEDVVGITAGTSTPDVLIDGVEKWLRMRQAEFSLTHAVM